ncbi:MAG: hypothetical protein FWF45_06565 [Coriobacteriia bacterium]|nr:hypothetical protein [Coriobacteriia bacterium]
MVVLDAYENRVTHSQKSTQHTKYSASFGIVLDQQQFDAMVDCAFNGQNDMKTAMRDIANGMDPRTAFCRKILQADLGLFRRRNDEANIFISGDYTRTYPAWRKY